MPGTVALPVGTGRAGVKVGVEDDIVGLKAGWQGGVCSPGRLLGDCWVAGRVCGPG
jgi:hypothetical protein